MGGRQVRAAGRVDDRPDGPNRGLAVRQAEQHTIAQLLDDAPTDRTHRGVREVEQAGGGRRGGVVAALHRHRGEPSEVHEGDRGRSQRPGRESPRRAQDAFHRGDDPRRQGDFDLALVDEADEPPPELAHRDRRVLLRVARVGRPGAPTDGGPALGCRVWLCDFVPNVEPALGDPAGPIADLAGDPGVGRAARVDEAPEPDELRDELRLVLARMVVRLRLGEAQAGIDDRKHCGVVA
jgi:hypothetical protein